MNRVSFRRGVASSSGVFHLALLFAGLLPAHGFAASIPECPGHLEQIAGDLPQYPSRNVYRPVEGWAKVTGKLDPEGKLLDLRIVDSEPTGFFDESALTAVKSWKFNWHGSWCTYTTTINYQLTREES